MTRIERFFEILVNLCKVIIITGFGLCLIGGMIELYTYSIPLFWIVLLIFIPIITIVSIGFYNYDYLYSEKWWKEIRNKC